MDNQQKIVAIVAWYIRVMYFCAVVFIGEWIFDTFILRSIASYPFEIISALLIGTIYSMITEGKQYDKDKKKKP